MAYCTIGDLIGTLGHADAGRWPDAEDCIEKAAVDIDGAIASGDGSFPADTVSGVRYLKWANQVGAVGYHLDGNISSQRRWAQFEQCLLAIRQWSDLPQWEDLPAPLSDEPDSDAEIE